MTLYVPRRFLAKEGKNYLYRFQIAVPRDATLMVVVFVNVHLLRIAFGLYLGIDTFVELEQAFGTVLSSEAAATDADELLTLGQRADAFQTLLELRDGESEEYVILLSIDICLLVFKFAVSFEGLGILVLQHTVHSLRHALRLLLPRNQKRRQNERTDIRHFRTADHARLGLCPLGRRHSPAVLLSCSRKAMPHISSGAHSMTT